jgi:hypothetical protein
VICAAREQGRRRREAAREEEVKRIVSKRPE